MILIIDQINSMSSVKTSSILFFDFRKLHKKIKIQNSAEFS